MLPTPDVQITPYASPHETMTVSAYIDAFSGAPWFDVWEPQWVADRLAWLNSVPNATNLVALDNDQVVGGLFGYAKPYKGRLDFEIVELFVSQAWQGQGIGKTLIATLDRFTQGKDINVVHLLTARDSTSEAFYQRLGFTRNDRLGFLVLRASTDALKQTTHD